ncbi:GNAT family N-acetyltransferase [Gimibacter soli]|uniref:GNAT family N-acetyltransferase n=1 Tax=Gimibacter soli TaxID=3024400 RepID=A0AAF0BNA8_9PROT|nr:GNAT family N-acetyltransferase [Gimibacter soli]WCL55711.1 GNAT family N-acetyltransferase [Gimibacter soli]
MTESRGILVREVELGDARALNAYVKRVYETSDHLITAPDEYRISTFARWRWIVRKLSSSGEICFIATDTGGEIIGMIDGWVDPRQRVRHVLTFAMSVRADRGRTGIGRKLLATLIDWVKAHPYIRKIELHVHADNAAAEALYTSFGFILEGERKGAVRYEDGRVVNDRLMALWP